MKSTDPKHNTTLRHPITIILIALAMATFPIAGAITTQFSTWVPTDRITHVHADPGNSDFGASIALDDDIAVIGNPSKQTAHIYEDVMGTWLQTATLSGPSGFGGQVVIHEDTLTIAAPSSSALHVHQLEDNGTWSHATELSVPGTGCLGFALEATEDMILATDPCTTDATYVFEKDESDWTITQEIEPPEAGAEPLAAGLDGAILVLGMGDAVYIYERASSTFELEDKVSVPHADRVDVRDGTVAAAGAVIIGTASIIEQNEDGWGVTAHLQPVDASPLTVYDRFGTDIALGDGHVLVGAPTANALPGTPNLDTIASQVCVSQIGFRECIPPSPGAVYAFEETPDSWVQTAKLTAHQHGDHRFGETLALGPDGENVFISAEGDAKRTFIGSIDAEDSVHVFTSLGTGAWEHS